MIDDKAYEPITPDVLARALAAHLRPDHLPASFTFSHQDAEEIPDDGYIVVVRVERVDPFALRWLAGR